MPRVRGGHAQGHLNVRVALLSDVHANLPALEAVLEDLQRSSGVDAVYHLGDLVGYGPWPDEVVTMLAQASIPGIAGNYDSTVATDYKHCGCRYEDPAQEALSHESYAWTRAHVSGATKRALGALPFRIDLLPSGGHRAGPRLVLVHGTPTLNTVYWTADRSDEFCLKMAGHAGLRAGDVIAFGHTHVPWYREIEGIHFVNAGSVGRPKDGDWAPDTRCSTSVRNRFEWRWSGPPTTWNARHVGYSKAISRTRSPSTYGAAGPRRLGHEGASAPGSADGGGGSGDVCRWSHVPTSWTWRWMQPDSPSLRPPVAVSRHMQESALRTRHQTRPRATTCLLRSRVQELE